MLIKSQGMKFFAKPDQQSYDFTLSDFTRDYQYHDLDLSGIIPAGTKAVLLWGAFKSDTADCEGSFAQSGHTGEYLKSIRFEPVANIGCNIDCLMPVNTDRKIRYRFSNVNYLYINLNIVAYFTG
jgi:homoserine acetyltransferase